MEPISKIHDIFFSIVSFNHRVYRVTGFLFSRRNLVPHPLPPPPPSEGASPTWVLGGATLVCEVEGGEPQFRRRDIHSGTLCGAVYYNTILILYRWQRGENSDSGFHPTVAERKASTGLESPERIGKIGPEAELSDILHKPASEENPVTSCLKLKIEYVKLKQKKFT